MQTLDNKGNKHTPHAKRRALLAAASFAPWGAFMARTSVFAWQQAWPLMLFYAILVLNTFFSVRTFASITPSRHIGQNLWDGLLVVFFLLMPLRFNSPLHFVLLATMFFAVSLLKYIFLIPIAGFSRLLYAKIRINALGVLLCIAVLTGILAGYAFYATALWAIIFLMANIYLLWWRPLYRLDMHRPVQ